MLKNAETVKDRWFAARSLGKLVWRRSKLQMQAFAKDKGLL